jgi:hypothetical protein
MNKETFNTLMSMIYPTFRNDWEIVNNYFTKVFKVQADKKLWEEWVADEKRK